MYHKYCMYVTERAYSVAGVRQRALQRTRAGSTADERAVQLAVQQARVQASAGQLVRAGRAAASPACESGPCSGREWAVQTLCNKCVSNVELWHVALKMEEIEEKHVYFAIY